MRAGDAKSGAGANAFKKRSEENKGTEAESVKCQSIFNLYETEFYKHTVLKAYITKDKDL